MEWYVWLVIAIIGLPVLMIFFGVLMIVLGGIFTTVAMIFSMVLYLSMSSSLALRPIYEIYIPQKNKKWLRHGLLLNVLKILCSPFGMYCIPVAYIQGKIVEKSGFGR